MLGAQSPFGIDRGFLGFEDAPIGRLAFPGTAAGRKLRRMLSLRFGRCACSGLQGLKITYTRIFWSNEVAKCLRER
jgi:hypothetical protein